MGQCTSVDKKQKRLRAFLFKRKRKSSLSAAFHVMDVNIKVDLLDVNSATEEELMTLPGVTRPVARNIVEYRQAIGGFKKVEDIALVSGVGAAKLNLFRPEICVSRKKNLSRTSSMTHSVDSVPSTESNTRSIRGSPVKAINVNKATVFDLMGIHGVTQELAANIVEYRDRKGPFRTINDLLKVKGLNYRKLGTIRNCLLLEDAISNGGNSIGSLISCQEKQNNHLGHRRTSSAPPQSNDTLVLTITNDATRDIFDLLSMRSKRPILAKHFHNSRNGRKAIRVATWNLEDLTADKVANPGVREVICRTILENGLSIVTLQEVYSEIALQKICDEMNQPSLNQVKMWESPRGKWNYCIANCMGELEKVPNNLGVLYDSSVPIDLTESSDFPSENNNHGTSNGHQIHASSFKVFDLTFALLNVHVQEKNGCPINREKLEGFLRSLQNENRNLVVLGDFSAAPHLPNNGDSGVPQLAALGFQNVVPLEVTTDVENLEKKHDNIWLSSSINGQFTGHWGVVRQGLSHLAIPNGWQLGGSASHHCPVWCELYCLQEDSGVVMNGVANEER